MERTCLEGRLAEELAELGDWDRSIDKPRAIAALHDGRAAIPADDLLHETAHHKLHAVEELGPLTRGGEDALWWSPWRRAWRPLRGIVHATYTFMHAALLFARMRRAAHGKLSEARRRFAAERLLEEHAALEHSLGDLEGAEALGLLSVQGVELRRELAALFEAEVRPEARAARIQLKTAGAAQALRRIDGARRLLRAKRRTQPGLVRGS